MKNYVTSATACMAGDCAMSSQCSRYQNFVEACKQDMVLQVINTSLLEVGDGGCRYLHIAKEVKAARGFKKMYDSIPRGAAVSVWQGFPGGISRRQFYRLLNGEIALLLRFKNPYSLISNLSVQTRSSALMIMRWWWYSDGKITLRHFLSF